MEQTPSTAPRPAAATPRGAGAGPWDGYRACRRFAGLDGLRALAMTTVVWNHSGRGDDYFGWGLGVKLFFVISGFLITTLLLRERDRTGTISLPGFFARRSLRIFPLYFAVLAAYVVLVQVRLRGTPAGEQFMANLPAYLTFTANWFVSFDAGISVIFYFAWSLSAQEQFYLVWPAVLRLARRWWVPVALLVASLAVALSVEALLAAGRLDRRFLPWRILSSFPVSIGMGFLAAHLLHGEAGHRWARRALGHRWSPLLGLALMLSQVAWPRTHDLVPTLGAVALVVACVLRPDNLLAPLLEQPLVRHVGTVSLGIYLMHSLAINAARLAVPGASRALAFAIAYPVAIAAATASYRWFEQPIAALRRRPAPAPVPASE